MSESSESLSTKPPRLLLLILVTYAVLQLAYMQRLPFVMDEFDGAYEAYRLQREVPYRDYVPYKTVLGYYAQLPATFFASSVWGRLLALELELIIINVAMMAAAALYCSRFLSRSAVVLALALFAASTPMMERAAEIRVDMLTAWAGLWSLLFLLRGRYALAGVLCAVSFGVSQKGALYVLASNAALMLSIAIDPGRRRAARAFLLFNAAAAAGLGAYLAFWSLLADPEVVLRSTFLAASDAPVTAAYDIQWRFWSQVLRRNAIVFLLAGVAVVWLARGRDRAPAASRIVAIYSGVLLLECAIYPQPWPYFFVMLFPTLFVLLAFFFDRLERAGLPRILLTGCVVLGVIYPLHRLFVLLPGDHAYQRYNVRLASTLLGPGERYLAAIDLIHDREQTPPELARLDAVGLHVLSQAGPETHARLLRDLDRSPPKLIIGTPRIYNLPPPLLRWIGRTYVRLSAGIWLYAPVVEAGSRPVRLDFAGRYRVESEGGAHVSIDGRTVADGAMLDLDRGMHSISTPAALRLRFLPRGIEEVVDPRYAAEEVLFPGVYD